MRFKLYENFSQDENDENDENELEILSIQRGLEKYIRDSNVDTYEEASYYYNTINKLDDEGGDVYRLIFLNNENELDKNGLGESWTIDINHLKNFAANLHRNYVIDAPNDEIKQERMNMTPYIITAHIDSYNIDFEKSIDVFTYIYYYEYEVILNSNPSNISIEEYERTWDDNDISE